MSDQRPAPRTRRGRVITVGVESVSELDRFLIAPAITADNVFDALGRITSATAREPISALLVDASCCTGNGITLTQAVRSIDPTVRIVSLGDLSPGKSTQGGFDDHVDQPLTLDALTRAFDYTVALRDEPLPDVPPTPRPVGREHRSGDAEQTLVCSPSMPEMVAAPSAEDLPEVTDDARFGDAAVNGDQSALGDVDLVACVAAADGSIGRTSLRLIIQQTGWQDLTLTDAEPRMEANDDTAAVEVRDDAESFGWLCSRQASLDDLRRWADWLHNWLSLGRTHQRYRELTYRDDLTGAHNRRFYHKFMAETIPPARSRRIPISIMVFDLDNFKQFNDRFGHAAGDEILIEIVRALQSIVRSCDKVCRIGGDEFVVIFSDLEGPREAGSSHPETVEGIARRFQAQVASLKFPRLSSEAPGKLTISAGLANFPWDSSDPTELLRLADTRALESKRAGKNLITFGAVEGDKPRPGAV